MGGLERLLMLSRVAVFLLSAATLSLFGAPASAQEMPSARTQEILIKSTLLTWTDALSTGNFSVMRALASDEFQAELSEQELLETFRPFQEEAADIRNFVVTMDPVPSSETGRGEQGQLILAGYFDTRPNQINYRLTYVQRAGGWKLLGINIRTAPPEENE